VQPDSKAAVQSYPRGRQCRRIYRRRRWSRSHLSQGSASYG